MLSISYLFEQDNYYRVNIRPGTKVDIVKKKDQQSGILTTGIVKRILTSKPRHTRGIKVMLDDGTVGRVQKIYVDDNNLQEGIFGDAKTWIKNTAQHHLNPINGVYTRLKDVGLDKKKALKAAGWYERNIYNRIPGLGRKTTPQTV